MSGDEQRPARYTLRDIPPAELLRIAARNAPGGEAAFWACAHGRDARSGCTDCLAEVLALEEEHSGNLSRWLPFRLARPSPRPCPLIVVLVHLCTPLPLPAAFLAEVNGYHGPPLAIDGPLGPSDAPMLRGATGSLYVIGGAVRAHSYQQAVAGVLGFLLHQEHVIAEFRVLEVEASRL